MKRCVISCGVWVSNRLKFYKVKCIMLVLQPSRTMTSLQITILNKWERNGSQNEVPTPELGSKLG